MIIKQLNYKSRIDLELKHKYLGRDVFAELMQRGFKYNKFSKTISKSYYPSTEAAKEYLYEHYQDDINFVKAIHEHYDHYIFELKKHHSNIKRG